MSDENEPNDIANELSHFADNTAWFVAGLHLASTSPDPAMRQWYADCLDRATESWERRNA